ncbi:unnamed protein product [Notodromas monacha]|uniref:Uncharacterized protein n=1 Tax=Notodromas monacha TaxID=399045 RepID=A0A7R9BDK6_9CRUS|nr:unnamed protein product [Notodromas monacha]CAG0912825.1 unnamed protein product [Notodromas monacha]
MLLNPLGTTVVLGCVLSLIAKFSCQGRPGSKLVLLGSIALLSVALSGMLNVWACDASALFLLPAWSSTRRTWPLRNEVPYTWLDVKVAAKSFGVFYFALLSSLAFFKVLRTTCRSRHLKSMHNCVGTMLSTVGLPCVAGHFTCAALGYSAVPLALFATIVLIPPFSAATGAADKAVSSMTLGFCDNGIVPFILLGIAMLSAAAVGHMTGVAGIAGILAQICVSNRRIKPLRVVMPCVANYWLMHAMIDCNSIKMVE